MAPEKRTNCRRTVALTTMAAVAFAVMGIEGVAVAQQANGTADTGHLVFAQASAVSRVRPVDRKARLLLEDGAAGSATFRAMIETLEQSDLIVYVETRALRPKLEGRLQLMAASRNGRYVLISVGLPSCNIDLVGRLAHELRHAVEVAGAPEIRDQQSLLRFYRRLGLVQRVEFVYAYTAETFEAQQAQRAVLNEMRTPKARAWFTGVRAIW